MCGVVGIYGQEHAAQIAYQVLWALQHRGQDSFGINTSVKGKIKGPAPQLGVLTQDFYNQISGLEGLIALGHVRYATAGLRDSSEMLKDSQPIVYHDRAIVHNGNVTNAEALRKELADRGSTFITPGSDTEVILQLFSTANDKTIEGKVMASLPLVKGAYSLVAVWDDTLIAARDPYGFRPLAIGRWGNNTYLIASETQALKLNNAEEVREINRGEVIFIDAKRGLRSLQLPTQPKDWKCIFELVYFAHPASNIFGLSQDAYWYRNQHGRNLALEEMASGSLPAADVVISLPDSGTPAAIGYAQASGLPFDFGLIRSHAAGRTFTLSRQGLRAHAVSQKLMPVRSVVAGKKIIVVDDSLVRGTTAKKVIRLVRDAGANEVHLRIASPPTVNPCYYGIDTPTHQELIAANQGINQICSFIGAESLKYLSLNGLHQPLGEIADSCDACFTGNYTNDIIASRLPIIKD